MHEDIDGNFAAGAMIQDSLKDIRHAVTYDKLKARLEVLCTDVERVIGRLPPGRQREVAQHLSSLVSAAVKEAPSMADYERSAARLIEALKGNGDSTAPAIDRIMEVLATLRGGRLK